MSIHYISRMFSPWARRLIAGVAQFSWDLCLRLALLIERTSEILAVAGVLRHCSANLLPARIAKWFAKFVALIIVLACGYGAASSWNGSPQDKFWAMKIY